METHKTLRKKSKKKVLTKKDEVIIQTLLQNLGLIIGDQTETIPKKFNADTSFIGHNVTCMALRPLCFAPGFQNVNANDVAKFLKKLFPFTHRSNGKNVKLTKRGQELFDRLMPESGNYRPPVLSNEVIGEGDRFGKK